MESACVRSQPRFTRFLPSTLSFTSLLSQDRPWSRPVFFILASLPQAHKRTPYSVLRIAHHADLQTSSHGFCLRSSPPASPPPSSPFLSSPLSSPSSCGCFSSTSLLLSKTCDRAISCKHQSFIVTKRRQDPDAQRILVHRPRPRPPHCNRRSLTLPHPGHIHSCTHPSLATLVRPSDSRTANAYAHDYGLLLRTHKRPSHLVSCVPSFVARGCHLFSYSSFYVLLSFSLPNHFTPNIDLWRRRARLATPDDDQRPNHKEVSNANEQSQSHETTQRTQTTSSLSSSILSATDFSSPSPFLSSLLSILAHDISMTINNPQTTS
jgi:hypothetical protein